MVKLSCKPLIRIDVSKESSKVIKALRDKAYTALNNIARQLKEETQIIFTNAMYRHPVVKDIISGGNLVGELGLENGRQAMADFINYLAKNITVHAVKPYNIRGELSVKIEVKLLPGDWLARLEQESPSFSTYISEHGYTIEWLNFLLKYGGTIAVYDYVYLNDGNMSRWSRTNQGIMINVAGSGWRVPMNAAGTPANNFVTDAIQQTIQEVTVLLTKELQNIRA